MNVVAFIAIYAAVISTIALFWQVYTWRKSRPDVVLTAKVNSLDRPDRPPVSREECVCTVVNSGGNPTSIIDIWADQVTNVDVLGAVSTRREDEGTSFPLRLGPGECHEWRFTFPKGYGLRCYAKDALGQVFRCNATGKP